MPPTQFTNGLALKRTFRCLIEDLLNQSPAPPSTSTKGLARAWLVGNGGTRPVAVNAWMRRALTDDAMNSQEVTITEANAAAYADELDDMIDDLVNGAQPQDPTLAAAWTWLKTDTFNPNDESIPSEALDFVDNTLPAA